MWSFSGRVYGAPVSAFGRLRALFLRLDMKSHASNPIKAKAPTAAPMPIPAFAPVLRPDETTGVENGVGVDVAVTCPALRDPVWDCVVVGAFMLVVVAVAPDDAVPDAEEVVLC